MGSGKFSLITAYWAAEAEVVYVSSNSGIITKPSTNANVRRSDEKRKIRKTFSLLETIRLIREAMRGCNGIGESLWNRGRQLGILYM